MKSTSFPTDYLFAYSAYSPGAAMGAIWMHLMILTWRDGYQPTVCAPQSWLAPHPRYAPAPLGAQIQRLALKRILIIHSDTHGLWPIHEAQYPARRRKRARLYSLNLDYLAWDWTKREDARDRLIQRLDQEAVPFFASPHVQRQAHRLLAHCDVDPSYPTPFGTDIRWKDWCSALQSVADRIGDRALARVIDAMLVDPAWGPILKNRRAAFIVYDEADTWFLRLGLRNAQ